MLANGFIISRHSYDQANGMVIEIWLQTEQTPIQLLINGERALFFIHTADAEAVKEELSKLSLKSYQLQPLKLNTFKQQPTTAVYFNFLNDFYKARDCLKQRQIICFEDDIRPEERYLMERFITADLCFTGEPQMSSTAFIQLTQVKCKKADAHIHLKMLSIDIECSPNGELYSIGAYSDSFEKVFMIGAPQQTTDIDIIWLPDEPTLLAAFIEWLQIADPDILIGWSVIDFDLRLIQKRCEHHQIPCLLGRNNSPIRWRNNPQTEQLYVDIRGRAVLDGIDLLKTATYNFPSFSLENVAQTLLGRGKKTEDVDNRLAQICHDFQHNKHALAAYNLEDCRLVWDIFAHTELLNFAILRAKLTGLAIDRIGGSAAAFTNLYLPKLHRHGYVAPNLGDGASDLVSPGGYVMDSIPGLFDNVLVLDFKSLYPSIIRTFKIDPMGLIEGLLATKDAIPGFDGALFDRDAHFLPDIIERLWQERDKAKSQQNKPLSQAIKIIMNSFYGILGSTGCRFFDPRLSGSITKRSHQILKTTKAWIEAEGYRVIYGDTDSIFVEIGGGVDSQSCQSIGQELARQINQRWSAELQQAFDLTSYLEIEFETHFSRFFMPTIRGQDVGTKKRYAGLLASSEDNIATQDRIVFKGLESVRTDWTALAKSFQQQLYVKVFNNQAVADFIVSTVNDTLSGKNDHQLVFRKRIRRKLARYVKNVPPHVRAARAADEQNKKQGKALKYQNRGWIEYLITVNGPEAIEYQQSAIDYQFYIERQLKAVADAILPFVDQNFDKIINNQLSLF